MTDDHPKPSDAQPPHAQVIQMGMSYWVSRAL
jgi:hypothetical protein